MHYIGIGTNRKIIDLFNNMKDGSLILKPFFQRKLVWNDTHKENFIDTILRGLPFPEIYLASGEIDLETQRSKMLVVDGQQRLSTIHQYISGSKEFKIKKIKTFQALTDKEKTDLFDYNVVVRDLGRIDDDKLIDVFQRINSVQYALNSIEIHNALYRGEFITTAKDILEKNKFYSQVEIFSENEYSRMKDLEFILLIMATVEEGGYFTGGKEIETYVEKYDPEYPQTKTMVSNFEHIFELIVKCNLQPDSIWLRKTNFFTICVELMKFKKDYGLLPEVKALRRMLVEFETLLYQRKNNDITKDEFAEYYYFIFQATASRTARNARGKLLRKYLDTIK